jgi:hypothetical protein
MNLDLFMQNQEKNTEKIDGFMLRLRLYPAEKQRI